MRWFSKGVDRRFLLRQDVRTTCRIDPSFIPRHLHIGSLLSFAVRPHRRRHWSHDKMKAADSHGPSLWIG